MLANITNNHIFSCFIRIKRTKLKDAKPKQINNHHTGIKTDALFFKTE